MPIDRFKNKSQHKQEKHKKSDNQETEIVLTKVKGTEKDTKMIFRRVSTLQENHT